ncbi:cytochrome P450 [Hysterangium stoloniferum]|nr:cytochrome P450 [Hysterangium stoloniferum]
MVAMLKAELSKSNRTSSVFDIMPFLSRTALDTIGRVSTNKKPYSSDTFMERPDSMIVAEGVMDWVPQWMVLILPSIRLKRHHNYMEVSLGVVKEVVDRQKAIHAAGKEGSKDIMIRANLAENPKDRLSEVEVLSQLTTLFFAGHDTTATAITWAIYELARNPEYQTLVRNEIRATRTQATQRGEDELSVADLDSMKSLLSLMKVCSAHLLRYPKN